MSRLMRAILVLLPTLALTTCYTIEEPPCPPIEIPENTGECSEFCQCDYDNFANTPFRLTRLEIDEPDDLASLLNLMWATDIMNNVVNVVLYVQDFEVGTAAAFDSITFRVGPGWRDPTEDLSIPPVEGEPSQSVINSYCMLEGMDVEMEVEPYHGNQCVFKSTAASALNFHSGPLGRPIICAPDLEPANSIPIKGMKTRFGLDEDCRGFKDGHLEGCISVKDADKVCMCLATGTCTIDPVEVPAYEPDDLSSYCKDVCGLKWVSLGQSMRAFGLTPTCLTQDQEPGYRIQGFIDGEAVPDHFNPVQSGDCTVY